MEFRVLGPLEVRVHDRPLVLRGTRARVVLAVLLLERNTVVPMERLISAIWGDDPPSTPTAQIQAAVSALRKTFAAAGESDRIVTRSPGYLIRVERAELDLDEFDREIAAARRMAAEGDTSGAAAALRGALEWWRDDALVDLAQLPIRVATVAVDERRWVALEECIDNDLALRRHADLVPELAALVTKKPLRDRLWGQLMRAQYRCGWRADALTTYRQARQVMRDELGLEPAAELVAIQRAILADDPALEPDVLQLDPAPERVRPSCPYRALAAYRTEDADQFFGRGPEVAEVLERARSGPVTVVGPSGAGKSSLVLAGVLPAVRRCTTLVVRPSDQGRFDLGLAAAIATVLPSEPAADMPGLAESLVDGGVDELVERVLRHTGDERLVVVVDQAEELLTQDAVQVDRLVASLYGSAAPDRLTVLATLRADFLGAVLERPALSGTLGGRAVFTLGAMGPDQLREAVTAPIERLRGVGFEPGLVDRILGDVGVEPGTLALLGLTLTLLWDGQVDGLLTHRAYDDLGRVPGAIATHAEGEWRRHNLADEEPVVRRLMGWLVQVQPGGQLTRRVMSRAELDEPSWRLAERLSATRLLVVTGDAAGAQTVELAHEALTTHWPRLTGWVECDLDFHLWRTALRHDVERWQLADQDPTLLVRGAVLADAQRWRTDRGDTLSPAEIDFVRRSEASRRSTGRRSWALRSAVAAGVVLALVLGFLVVQQRTRTAAAKADADSRALAAASDAVEGRPGYAALLAVAAHDRAPTAEARSALFSRYKELAGLDALYPAPDLDYGSANASADGRVVTARSEDELMIWIRRGDRAEELRRPRLNKSNAEVAADGSAVWLLTHDGIGRLDVATGETRTVIPVPWSDSPQLALSPDGSRILMRELDPSDESAYLVREWSTRNGQELGSASVRLPATIDFAAVRAGPTPGSALIEFRATTPATFRVELLDMNTGRSTVTAAGASGSISADRSSVVTCTAADKEAVLTATRAADGVTLGSLTLPNVTSICPSFVAGPAGRVVVDDETDVRLLDIPTGTAATVNALSRSRRLSLPDLATVTVDGSHLVGSASSSVVVIDLTAPDQVTPELRNAELLSDGRGLLGLSPDGRNLAIAPLVAGGPAATAPRPSPYLAPFTTALATSESGLLADRVGPNRIMVRRLAGLAPLATVDLPAGELHEMYLDRADRLVTVVDRQVSWWDPDSGALEHRIDLGSPGPGFRVSEYPDPNVIAVSDSAQPDITLRSMDDGHVVGTIPVGPGVEAVSFQRSSDYLLVSRPTSTEVWNHRTGQRVFGPLPVPAGALRVAGMTEDAGRFMVLDEASSRWRSTNYQVGDQEPVDSFDLGSTGIPVSRSGDGNVVSFLGWDDDVVAAVLHLDPATWRAETCAALGGMDFTPGERAAFPAIPDGPACGPGGSAVPPDR